MRLTARPAPRREAAAESRAARLARPVRSSGPGPAAASRRAVDARPARRGHGKERDRSERDEERRPSGTREHVPSSQRFDQQATTAGRKSASGSGSTRKHRSPRPDFQPSCRGLLRPSLAATRAGAEQRQARTGLDVYAVSFGPAVLRGSDRFRPYARPSRSIATDCSWARASRPDVAVRRERTAVASVRDSDLDVLFESEGPHPHEEGA